jgi:hypothetical protein
MRTTTSRLKHLYLLSIAFCLVCVYNAMYLTKSPKIDVSVGWARRKTSHVNFDWMPRSNYSKSSTFVHHLNYSELSTEMNSSNHSNELTLKKSLNYSRVLTRTNLFNYSDVSSRKTFFNYSELHTRLDVSNHSEVSTVMHYTNHSKLSIGTLFTKEIHANVLVSMIETNPLQLYNLCAYVDNELFRIKKETWRNGSKGVSSGVKMVLESGEHVREWFDKHDSYGQDWMRRDKSVDEQYDKMYRDRGVEIFQKKRFSPNVFKAMRISNNEVYQNIGDGIDTDNVTKLDTGLIAMSGMSSWPDVMVFRDANINGHGHLQTHEIIMANAGCGDGNVIASDFMGQSYDLVISIAQFWGYGYFHLVFENVVRLAPLLNITDRFQQSMVHVSDRNSFTMEYLQSFGIPHHRVLKGDASVRILIVPQPVLCYTPSTVLLRVLRQVLLRTTMSTSTFALGTGLSTLPTCRILVVHRSGARRVLNHDVMFKAIKHQHPGCELVVHTGNEHLTSQLELFRKSTTIVAPHGAGLSNIIVSRPGTGILEFLVINKEVQLCYMIAAAKLGLQYWALAFSGSSHGGTMTADIIEVLSVVKEMVTYTLEGHVSQ